MDRYASLKLADDALSYIAGTEDELQQKSRISRDVINSSLTTLGIVNPSLMSTDEAWNTLVYALTGKQPFLTRSSGGGGDNDDDDDGGDNNDKRRKRSYGIAWLTSDMERTHVAWKKLLNEAALGSLVSSLQPRRPDPAPAAPAPSVPRKRVLTIEERERALANEIKASGLPIANPSASSSSSSSSRGFGGSIVRSTGPANDFSRPVDKRKMTSSTSSSSSSSSSSSARPPPVVLSSTGFQQFAEQSRLAAPAVVQINANTEAIKAMKRSRERSVPGIVPQAVPPFPVVTSQPPLVALVPASQPPLVAPQPQIDPIEARFNALTQELFSGDPKDIDSEMKDAQPQPQQMQVPEYVLTPFYRINGGPIDQFDFATMLTFLAFTNLEEQNKIPLYMQNTQLDIQDTIANIQFLNESLTNVTFTDQTRQDLIALLQFLTDYLAQLFRFQELIQGAMQDPQAQANIRQLISSVRTSETCLLVLRQIYFFSVQKAKLALAYFKEPQNQSIAQQFNAMSQDLRGRIQSYLYKYRCDPSIDGLIPKPIIMTHER
jgi:hypothetical protein